ncbi:MAG: CRISPR-associated ring nuclease Csm6 [Sphingomonadaceae bacterium]|uniref:CRISPR-associated ring nuclease Csm6 n=1 Tax=Thermaurantiacus sp. TaxID=2820283 RepID=UPI00298EFA41|nr:CRISPR-associated ring nuclease Csm6 [Thermaurantiacus sp.]MCS6986309.1 CRISPR-associated ring nuclease Csm6 [Sphingomonadaceae bacterium]MDW8415758.1 CRISPR-associated ring nuclease Csm6 [Thermaurantiacus sp.]
MPALRTLLFTAGETPQVVTETVWALARHQEPPWRPDRIVLATTARGARIYRDGRPERGQAPLLGDGGKLAGLWRTLFPDRPMPTVQVLVPNGALGPIEDLRTEAEVEAFAEELVAAVAQVTAEPEGELHLSLAGGRKTMSFLAGQVLSLLARPQDVLSHVLIEPAELEFRPDFWWPGDGSPGSDAARVRLHHVPFLRARAWADPKAILAGPEGRRFRAAVDRANLGLRDPDVVLDLASGEVMAGLLKAKLTPREAAAVALVFVAAKREAALRHDTDADGHQWPTLAGDRGAAVRLWSFLAAAAEWRRHVKGATSTAGARGLLDEAMSKHARVVDYGTNVGPALARARKKLQRAFTPELADRILCRDPPSTALVPSRLRVLLPAELADHPNRPHETEVAPAS